MVPPLCPRDPSKVHILYVTSTGTTPAPSVEGSAMRAMAVTGYGEPLERIEVPEPELIPGYAILEVLACGVCFSDVKTSRGHMPYSANLPLPHVPGHEIFGRVLTADPPGLVPDGMRAVVYHYWPCGRCLACRRGD